MGCLSGLLCFSATMPNFAARPCLDGMMRQAAIRQSCHPVKSQIRVAAPQSSSPVRIVYDPLGKRKQACLAAALVEPARCPKTLSLANHASAAAFFSADLSPWMFCYER